MARLGVRLEVTEKLLNDVSGSVGGIVGVHQRHEFVEEMREAISRYEAWLSHVFETTLMSKGEHRGDERRSWRP